ncbi:transmembrane protein 14A isoform X2 [Strigops habroptila]|uniref:transmembrane protein 14A isoform X2 n=1 Tax=Strigops habroptila TaxID=2489341 RepID=UPI0011CF0D0C|nr:transmembrane protein 14A isoform X2 [Strigops habroptila]
MVPAGQGGGAGGGRRAVGQAWRGGTRVGTMAIDWIGFAYAALLAVGGVVAYTRKGSKISLAAGLTFGSAAGYGAYCITRDPRNVKVKLLQNEDSVPFMTFVLCCWHCICCPLGLPTSCHRQGCLPCRK